MDLYPTFDPHRSQRGKERDSFRGQIGSNESTGCLVNPKMVIVKGINPHTKCPPQKFRSRNNSNLPRCFFWYTTKQTKTGTHVVLII